VRWQGFLKPPTTGSYKIYIELDDGGRVFLDGNLIIESWKAQVSLILISLFH